MKASRAIVFDLGKVLVHFDYGIMIEKFRSRTKVSPGRLKELIDASPLLFRYETGLLTTEQFFQEVRIAASFDGDLNDFSDIFGNIFSPIPEMIGLHAEFRERGFPTFIFSNTNDLAIRDIRSRFPFFGSFTDYILSYEHGYMKPDTRLYAVVENITGCKGPEIVYFDDRPENIETGLARGWRAILHEAPEKTRAAVQQFGILD